MIHRDSFVVVVIIIIIFLWKSYKKYKITHSN